MIASLCNKICDYFVASQIIPEEDKPLYLYGLHQSIIMIANIAITLLIGYILGMMWHSLLYLLTYIPIRTYGGGFHAKTPLRCYCSSVILVIATLLAMKLIPWTPFICIIGITFSIVFIIILAPIEDKNKPFSAKEKTVFKKRTRIILFIEITLYIISLILHFSILYLCICMSLVTLSLMLILGRIKNYFLEKNATT